MCPWGSCKAVQLAVRESHWQQHGEGEHRKVSASVGVGKKAEGEKGEFAARKSSQGHTSGWTSSGTGACSCLPTLQDSKQLPEVKEDALSRAF